MSNRLSTEEMEARKMVNDASVCGKGLDEDGKQVSITIDEPKSYSAGNEWMEEKLRSIEKIHEDKIKEYQKPRIRRIPALLSGRESTEKYYAPRAISIGPLHHGDPRFEETKDLKLQMTRLFIMEHNIQKKELYKKIEFNINHLKSRYVEGDIKGYSNQELTWIFLVDGCSTLHCMDTLTSLDLEDWKIKQDHLLVFRQDIFLLENQLPFELLQLIMDICPNGKSESLMKSIYIFIYYAVLVTRNLLDPTTLFPQATTAYEEDKKSESTTPTHLLDLFRNILFRDSYLTEGGQERMMTVPESFKQDKLPNFRSASELKDIGIIFKPLQTSSIKNIRFTREKCTGVLHLPALSVSEATAPQLMNLVAYEMCPDYYNDLQVTSYLSFMDTLIDLPNDVKILRDARVLLNFLGSEESVTELFKSFRTSGAIPNNNIYVNVQLDIQRYYDRTVQIASWMRISRGINDYFGTPWKAMASIAVVLELTMSFIQTFYAVKENK